MKRLLISITAISVLFATGAGLSAHEPHLQPQPNKDKRAQARKQTFQALLNRHLQGPRPAAYVGGYGNGYGYGGGNNNYGGYGGWSGYHHASTVGESYARGWAAMKEAQGRYNRDTAEARILNEEAYSRALDNWRKGVDTYFDGREANRNFRDAERGERISVEALRRIAKGASPERLSPSELNAATGKIAWPVLLQEHYFADLRDQVEGIFGKHAITRGLNADQFRHAEQVTATMLDRLKEYVESAKPMDYTDALRFIESLAYEARLSFNAGNRAG